MKNIVAIAAGVTMGLSLATAQAADTVTVQLKWVAQAQFAGYFVAKEKGFYKDAGLDVTIKPGGPDVAPPQVIAGGTAFHFQRLEDQCHAGVDRRDRGRILRNADARNRLSHLDGSGANGDRYGVGGNRSRRDRRNGVLRTCRACRARDHFLASIPSNLTRRVLKQLRSIE